MSSDLFLYDSFLYSSSNMVSPDIDIQFQSQPFFTFEEPSYIDYSNQQFPIPFSSSPPNQQLNNLSLGPTTQLQSLPPTSAISADGLTDFSVFDTFGVKSEECYMCFNSSHSTSLLPNEKVMQRSFSSQSLDQKQSFFFQPHFNSLLEVPSFQTQVVDSPENSKFNGPMRRVCSTGDLYRIETTQPSRGISGSPLAAENSFMVEASFKVGRYNAEEKKQRIERYRNKRTQRNFNKTIKYACRKTLADSRPRVRGRFARNDESGDIPKVTGFNREEEDEDELWVDGFHEEDNEGTAPGGGFVNCPSQFQYSGFDGYSRSYPGNL